MATMCAFPTHRNQYKRTNHQWKEAYRQRFRERIKERRSHLVAQNRCLFPDESLSDEDWYKQLMEISSDLFRCHHNHQDLTRATVDELQLSSQPFVLGHPGVNAHDQEPMQLDVYGSDNLDADLLQIMEEVENEINIEQEQLALYEESQEYEESYKESMALMQMDDYLCPFCRTNFSVDHTSQLVCACTPHVDSELQNIDASSLHQQLNE